MMWRKDSQGMIVKRLARTSTTNPTGRMARTASVRVFAGHVVSYQSACSPRLPAASIGSQWGNEDQAQPGEGSA